MKSIIFVNLRWNCRGCNKTYPSRRQMECCHQVALGAIIRCIICNFDLPRSKKFWWHNTLSSVIQGQKSVTLFSLARKDRAPAVHLCCINPESTPRKTTEHKTRKPFYEAGKKARNNNSATPGDISPLRSPSLSISLHGIHHSLIYSD